jgi:hypothetical protein
MCVYVTKLHLLHVSSYSGSSGVVSALKYFSPTLLYSTNVFFSIFYFPKNITVTQVTRYSEMSPKTEFEKPT